MGTGRAGEEVLDEKVLMRGVEVPVKSVKLRRRKGLRIVPPDRVLGFMIADDELVGSRPAGVGSRHDS